MNPQEETHILLAEDDEDDYHIFALTIAKISYRILLTHAQDSSTLMKLLKEKAPDILFLDIYLPGTDGKQCLKVIRDLPQYDTLPVIIYSSIDDLKNIEFCYREGANLYIVKPSSLSELKTMLEKVLAVDWRKAVYFPPLSQFVLKGQRSD